MDDSFDPDEHGGDEFDNPCFIVRAIHIFGSNWYREMMMWDFVSFDKAPIEAVDQGSTIDEGLGDDVFAESVFEHR